MNFKKIITQLLAFTLALSLAACGEKSATRSPMNRTTALTCLPPLTL